MTETLAMAVKFMFSSLGILAIIYVFLELTPKIAKKVDNVAEGYRKKRPKPPEDERLYLVRSPFDGTHEIDVQKLQRQELERQKLAQTSKDNQDDYLESIGDVNDDG